MANTTSSSNRPGGGITWDGQSNETSVGNSNFGPVDLSSEYAIRLNFSEVNGEAWVWYNLRDTTGLVSSYSPPNWTVSQPGTFDIPLSELTISPFHSNAPKLTVEELLKDVGSISINFRASSIGSFDLRLDSVEIVPEPSTVVLAGLAILLDFGPRRRS